MKRRVSIVVGGLASAALLSLAPATAASADGPHDSGNVESNGNSAVNIPVGLCGSNIPVLSIPVPVLNGGNQNVGQCISQGIE
ncbi:hypothetical protein [Actinomadura litoris]|uniref:hypothetical protein n=1 Tax=Actinomadura litoris TaxID=2678616 RepID=UPI001FA7779A|nr:hypothetical protein [Actinomadura litoris]